MCVPIARDGANNKKCILMLRCVRKPCLHAARHRMQTHFSSRYTAPQVIYTFKYPPTSEKN